MSDSPTPGPAANPKLNPAVGGFLIGSWVHTILWTVVIHQTYTYFRRRWQDPWLLKLWIGFMATAATADLVIHLYVVYETLITGFGNPFALFLRLWCLPVNVAIGTLIGAAVNFYLLYRLHRLTQRRIISVPIGVLVFINMAFSYVLLALISNNSRREKNEFLASFFGGWALIGSAVASLSLSAGLVVKLQSMRPGYKRTEDLITRLTVHAIRTGVTSSIIALVVVGFYLADREGLIGPIIGYSSLLSSGILSMLVTLNLHTKINDEDDEGTGYLTTSNQIGVSLSRTQRTNSMRARTQSTVPRVELVPATPGITGLGTYKSRDEHSHDEYEMRPPSSFRSSSEVSNNKTPAFT